MANVRPRKFMNSTTKTPNALPGAILAGCIPYNAIKDEIIDHLYANAFDITSEKEFLASCGFNSLEISKWSQHKANQKLKQRIVMALKNYNNPREEFLSSYDNVSVKAIWRNHRLYLTILYSPFLTKKSNSTITEFEGLGFLDDNNPGEATAFTVPKNWLF